MLEWDVTACQTEVDILSEPEWLITHTLIYATAGIGMPRLTEANIDTFAERLEIWAAVVGPLITQVTTDGDVRPVRITRTDLRRRIGLRTNASPKTDAAFRGYLWRLLKERAGAAMAADKAAEAAQ